MSRATYDLHLQSQAVRQLIDHLGEDAHDLDIIEGETNILEAIERVQQEYRDMDGEILKNKALKDLYAKAESAARERKNKLKQSLARAVELLPEQKIKTDLGTCYYSSGGMKLDVYDEDQVPLQYRKQEKPPIIRKDLTDALKALGPDDDGIPGARLVPADDKFTVK